MQTLRLGFIVDCPWLLEISEDELQQWTEQFYAAQSEGEAGMEEANEIFSILFPNYTKLPLIEAWVCGQWLHRELVKLDCDSDLAGRICFALGQVLAAQVDLDPWGATIAALDEYKAGRHEEPGEALAVRLMAEQFTTLVQRFGHPSPEAILRAQRLAANMRPPISPY